MDFDRIIHSPEVMGGKACIRGLRVTVGMVVAQIGYFGSSMIRQLGRCQ